MAVLAVEPDEQRQKGSRPRGQGREDLRGRGRESNRPEPTATQRLERATPRHHRDRVHGHAAHRGRALRQDQECGRKAQQGHGHVGGADP